MIKKAFRTKIFFVAAALCCATASFAQDSLRSPVLKQFEEAGGSVDFIGSSHGLDGWVVRDEKGDVKQTVYTTADGALVLGMLFSPDGKLETKGQLEEYHKRATGSQSPVSGAEASSSKSEKLYAQIEQSKGWVALGKEDAPYIYVFMNVTCDHCQNFWKDIEPSVQAGKIQVRFIPYGKAKDNRDGGAALLSAEDPAAAWKAYLSGDKSVLSADKVKPDAYDKVDSNTDLTNAWKLAGPPFTLYRRPGDGILTAIAGRPSNPMLLMAEFIK